MKTFKETVLEMSAKQLIMAMVDGLKEPTTDKVDMGTYGKVRNGVCFGCAATNAIQRIAGKRFEFDENGFRRSESMDEDKEFMSWLESGFNNLRFGDIDDANYCFSLIDLPTITNRLNIKLPELTTINYKENLEPYIQLADSQE